MSQNLLREKVAQLPLAPGVYLYKDAAGKVIYVGKAKILRARVRSYFNEDQLADAKTGSLIAEARDIDYILVDNEKEALALENNLIKQYKPRFNVLLRDDKTYPYIKLTSERFPARLRHPPAASKTAPLTSGPIFPATSRTAWSTSFTGIFWCPRARSISPRYHPKPCLQYHIHRCSGPCVEGLTTPEAYAQSVRQVRLFLEGRHAALASELREPHSGSGVRRHAIRRSRRPCAICSPPSKRWNSARRWPPPPATTPISSATTPSRRWLPSTCSISAMA